MSQKPHHRPSKSLPSHPSEVQNVWNGRDRGQKNRFELTSVFAQVLDLQRVMAGRKNSINFDTKDNSDTKSGHRSARNSRIRQKFVRAVVRIIDQNRIKKLRISSADIFSRTGTTRTADFSERLIDYFLVFETSLDEDCIRRNTLTLTGSLVDHAPSFQHKDCPIQPGWKMMAFPKPPTLSLNYRPPTILFSVFTQPDGSRIFAVFLQYDEEISPQMRKKLQMVLERREKAEMAHSPSVVHRIIQPYRSGNNPGSQLETFVMDPDCRFGSIRVRSEPDIGSSLTGKVVGKHGSSFVTIERVKSSTGQIYLRLADGSGWVFMNDPKDCSVAIVVQADSRKEVEDLKDLSKSPDVGIAKSITPSSGKHSRSSSAFPLTPQNNPRGIARPKKHKDFRLVTKVRVSSSHSLLEKDYEKIEYEFKRPPLDFFDVIVDSYDDIIIINIDQRLTPLRAYSQIVRVNGVLVPRQGGKPEVKYVEQMLTKPTPLSVEFHVPHYSHGSINDPSFPIVRHDFEVDAKELGTHECKTIYRPRVLGIVSHYPLFEQFQKALEHLLEVCQDPDLIKRLQVEPIVAMLVHKLPVPVPGRFGVSFAVNSDYIGCALPCVRSPFLSTFPLKNLFNELSVENILVIFAALVHESRIVMHCHSLKTLTVTAQCLLQLLYPMSWTHTYIPVLPKIGLLALQQPSPYVIGLPTDVFNSLQQDEAPTGVYIVDLNQDRVLVPETPQWEDTISTSAGPERDMSIASSSASTGMDTLAGSNRAVSAGQQTSSNSALKKKTRKWSFLGKRLAKRETPSKPVLKPRSGQDLLENDTTASRQRRTGSLASRSIGGEDSPRIFQPVTSPDHSQDAHDPESQLRNRCSKAKAPLPPKYYVYLKKVFKVALHMRSIDNDFVSVPTGKNRLLLRFDRQVYAAIYHFYASLLQGYRKFLTYVETEPFFNMRGFFASVEDPDARKLLRYVIGSTDQGMNQSFYTFLTEDTLQGPIHDYINRPNKELLKKINSLHESSDDLFMYKIIPDGVRPPNVKKRPDLTKLPSFRYPFSTKLSAQAIEEHANQRIEFERSEEFLAYCRIRKAQPLCEMWHEDLSPKEKIEFFMIKVFKGERISADRLKSLADLLDKPEARERLRYILRQSCLRSETTHLSSESFNELSEVLNTALRSAQKYKDYDTIVMIWEGSTRFVTEAKSRKFHLEERLKDAPVWEDIEFWNAAADLKAEEIVRDMYSNQKKDRCEKPQKLSRSKSLSLFEEKTEESARTSRELAAHAQKVKEGMLEWLPRTIFKMAESNLEIPNIFDFLKRLSTQHDFSTEEYRELEILLEKSISAKEALAAMEVAMNE